MRKRCRQNLQYAFYFLAVGFLMLLSPYIDKAQDNSVNLVGEWYEKPIYPGPILGDGAEVIIQLTYIFDNSSKVTQVATVTKGMFRRMAMNYQTGQMYCCEIVNPVITKDSEVGTYKIAGRSILLEFSKFRRKGTISDNLIKGVKVDKLTGKEEEWIIAKTSIQIIQRAKESLPANVVRNGDGKIQPANGYEWVSFKNPSDLRVQPKTGLREVDPPIFIFNLVDFDPNVIGKVKPTNGYRWVNADDPDHLDVEPMPWLTVTKTRYGKPIDHRFYKEYRFNPAKGYKWINPNAPKDLRVERIP